MVDGGKELTKTLFCWKYCLEESELRRRGRMKKRWVNEIHGFGYSGRSSHASRNQMIDKGASKDTRGTMHEVARVPFRDTE
jgi:hypothetical protein